MSSAAGSGKQADPTTDSVAEGGVQSGVYGASTIKRKRRTNAELATLNELIIDVVEQDYPVSLRGVYYRVVSAGGDDKTEHAYRAVGRRLLELRRQGEIAYDRISDGTRWVVRPRSYDDLGGCAHRNREPLPPELVARPGCRGPHLHREGRDHLSDRAGDERVECAARCAPRLLLGNLRVLDGAGHCGLEEADVRLPAG